MNALSLASLMLAPVLLAATAYAALVALEHPDEATATRQWITLSREQSLRLPPATAPASRPPAGEIEHPSSDLPDPFQLEDEAATATLTSRQARSKASPATESEEEEDLAVAAVTAVAAPSPSSAPATPARPALRLLGTLRRNDQRIALVELDGATRRLQVGDLLPGALGEVLTVHEDQIDIRHAGSTQTITMENYAVGALPTVTPYARNARNARNQRLAPRSNGLHLIRPRSRQ